MHIYTHIVYVYIYSEKLLDCILCKDRLVVVNVNIRLPHKSVICIDKIIWKP